MKRGRPRVAASAQTGRGLNRYRLRSHPLRPPEPLSQTQAEPDPGRAGEHEVDAKKNAEHVERGHRPMDQDDDAKQQRDQARSDDPAPWRPALHVEAEEDAHDARCDERRAENERQPHRGQQRIVERHEPGDDVEDAESQPEQEASPGLDLERVDDLENARDDHHDSDNVDRRHRRHDDAAKSDHASDEVDDAEGDDPAPFAPERRDARAGSKP